MLSRLPASPPNQHHGSLAVAHGDCGRRGGGGGTAAGVRAHPRWCVSLGANAPTQRPQLNCVSLSVRAVFLDSLSTEAGSCAGCSACACGNSGRASSCSFCSSCTNCAGKILVVHAAWRRRHPWASLTGCPVRPLPLACTLISQHALPANLQVLHAPQHVPPAPLASSLQRAPALAPVRPAPFQWA